MVHHTVAELALSAQGRHKAERHHIVKHGRPRLMIVSSRTPDIDDFCAMCLPNVMIVRYDFDGSQDDWMKSVASSWDDWVKRVVDAGEAVACDDNETFGKFITVALANHGPPGDRWDILATVGLDVPSGTPDAGLEDMLELMASLASSRVDLLACGLAATEAGVRFVEKTETRLGVNFAASDDVTGNPAAGGDWILETDDINIKCLYFDLDKMAAVEGSFLLKKQQALDAKKAHVDALIGEFGDAGHEVRRLESEIRITRRRDEWLTNHAKQAKESRGTKHRHKMPSYGPVVGMEILRRDSMYRGELMTSRSTIKRM